MNGDECCAIGLVLWSIFSELPPVLPGFFPIIAGAHSTVTSKTSAYMKDYKLW